jgi:ACS family tartrate transporter-like MFS transporter
MDGREGTAALSDVTELDSLERSTIRRMFWRLVPFLVLAYIISQLDRSNISIAALQMNGDLKLSAAQYGLAAAIYYIPYCVLEVPSSWMLTRYGARRWIARIMISWGVVCVMMAFVKGPYSLYSIRFLLGAAEAGFYPGVIFYLSLWFPARYRGRIYAVFSTALPIAYFVGSPIAAWLLEMDGFLALRGWQWLFIIESLPAILFGYVFLRVMVDGPRLASWLSPRQREWLVTELALDEQRARQVTASSGWRSLFSTHVLGLSLVFSGSAGATAALGLWMPQILKAFGMSNMSAALLNMLPYAAACGVMLWWGRASDRSKRSTRSWRTVLPLILIGASLAATVFAKSLAMSMVLLTLAFIGTYALKGPFWSLVSDWTPTPRAATTIAQVNAISNLAGFGGTYLVGIIKDQTGSFSIACLPLAGLAVIAAVTLVLLNRMNNRPTTA